jgi:hypothetical protein
MTSAINYLNINTAYPVAGQDNNSQGFRDNFTAISAGLAQASTEITALQTNSISTALANNDLLGSNLKNGTFSQLNPKVYTGGNTTGATVNIDNGPVQLFTLTGAATFTFANWGASGTFSKITVIIGSGGGTQTATFSANLKYSTSGFTSSSITVSSANVKMLEFWTTNGGTSVFGRLVQEYVL